MRNSTHMCNNRNYEHIFGIEINDECYGVDLIRNLHFLDVILRLF